MSRCSCGQRIDICDRFGCHEFDGAPVDRNYMLECCRQAYRQGRADQQRAVVDDPQPAPPAEVCACGHGEAAHKDAEGEWTCCHPMWRCGCLAYWGRQRAGVARSHDPVFVDDPQPAPAERKPPHEFEAMSDWDRRCGYWSLREIGGSCLKLEADPIHLSAGRAAGGSTHPATHEYRADNSHGPASWCRFCAEPADHPNHVSAGAGSGAGSTHPAERGEDGQR